MSEEHIITDSYQRRVSYLRFSVTDRCNLHCVYCRSDGPEEFIPHEDVLRYEEIIRLVHEQGIFKMKNAVPKVAQELGVSKNTVYLHLRSLKNAVHAEA